MQTLAINRVLKYLVALCVVVAGCSSDRTKSILRPATDVTATTAVFGADVAPTVATTTAADVATTVPTDAATLPPATTVPEPAATTTTLVAPVPAADSPTVWVDGAEGGDPEVTAAPGVCEPFYDAIAGGPYTVQRCGLWNAIGGQRVWTVTKGATGRFFAIVWQQSAPNTWVPLLRALEGSPGVWSDFTIRTANIDSGSNDELVSAVRIAGTGDYLDVAVVDIRSGEPRVMAVHNENTKGVAVLRAGSGVEVWSGVYADGDPGCCPSRFVQTFVTADGGDWFVRVGATLPAGDPGIPLTEF